jgi:hypothetical protein
MKTNETLVETLNTADYYVNYYGQRLDIKPMTKVYALFTNGGGYGSGSNYDGYSKYDLYKPVNFLVKELVKVGTASVWYNGYDIDTKIELDGQEPINLSGIDLDAMFLKIFKRD